MQEIVINKCCGGFGLSYKAVMEYARLKGITIYGYAPKRIDCSLGFSFCKHEPYCEKKHKDLFMPIYYSTKPLTKKQAIHKGSYWNCRDISRDDPDLVRLVRKLRKKANGECAELKVVKIPDGVEWHIEEYDGKEWIAENHRTWD
jgi:hypothetical protein